MSFLRRKRFPLLLLILIISFVFSYFRLSTLSHNSYAYTFSFGNGYGFSVYTQRFALLPESIQQNVVAHEQQHLQDGTIQFWKYNELEKRAYVAELQQCRKQKLGLMSSVKGGMSEDYYYLESYERDILEKIEKYSK